MEIIKVISEDLLEKTTEITNLYNRFDLLTEKKRLEDELAKVDALLKILPAKD